MLLSSVHHADDPINRFVGQGLMEKVRHRIDEDPPWLPPVERCVETTLDQGELAGPAGLAVAHLGKAVKGLSGT
jgi:hypothetical protein